MRLQTIWQAVRSSYWFIPTVMAVLAVILGVTMIWIDVRYGHGWIDGLSWYHQVRSEGAREVLSTIAGSMITVAGVVFSITIVALSYASSQYGPRVLTNFMSDRGNTVTLGTFIATFAYCLVVLRTIRGGEDSFVPQYAVLVAMLLAVCSIGVLIYFIHHVPQSIHINNVVARIGEQLIADTCTRFPQAIGSEPRASHPAPISAALGVSIMVPSRTTGYVQAVDEDRLLEVACHADALIELRYRPGDFIAAGRDVAEVRAAREWGERDSDDLRGCFTVGRKRTPENDLMFLVSELVEIAARALSPGVNDPVTASTCLDWLGAGSAAFAGRGMPHPIRVDESGTARVISRVKDFELFVRDGFGKLRQYAARDAIATMHLLEVLGEVAATCRTRDQIDVLRTEAALLRELALEELKGEALRAAQDRAAALIARLSADR
jgi:uncharacterized membrane protein